jgi:hypothetical protein
MATMSDEKPQEMTPTEAFFARIMERTEDKVDRNAAWSAWSHDEIKAEIAAIRGDLAELFARVGGIEQSIERRSDLIKWLIALGVSLAAAVRGYFANGGHRGG